MNQSTESIFDRAKRHITPGLIRRYTPCDSAEEQGAERKTLNPSRADKSPGSFFINLDTGLWKDYATDEKGDIFNIISVVENCSLLEAAKKVLTEAGEYRKEKPKVAAKIIDLKGMAILPDLYKEKWVLERYGTKKTGYPFFNKKGEKIYVQIRFMKGSEKSDIPFYLGIDNRWHAGLPPRKKGEKLPLYGLNRITENTKKVILVEGCKCAEIRVRGFEVISWGSSTQHHMRDWSPLKKRKDIEVIIWPDKDMQADKNTGGLLPKEKQPGMKAAIEIKTKYLPWAEILDPYEYDRKNEMPPGWDIADCEERGYDIMKPINESPRYTGRVQEEDGSLVPPFRFLGYSNEKFFFLPDAAPYPVGLKMNHITKNQLMLLARLDWWIINFPSTSNSNLCCWDSAFDWVIRESQSTGWFSVYNIRGTGFWNEEGKFGKDYFCNTGKKVISPEGKETAYKNMISENIYIQSDFCVKSLSNGPPADKTQGQKLREMFECQGFKTKLQAWEALGWSLMAPFGSILPWRPIIWITGHSGTGKSHLIDNIISPLCGEFAEKGNSLTTSASLKRLNTNVILLDEMEANGGNDNRDHRKKIRQIINMARDATSNASNRIQQMGKSGVDTFILRSMFLFSSVVPTITGAAMQSRFFVPELDRAVSVEEKKKKTWELLTTGFFRDPTCFMRRNFRNIKQIMKNIEWLRDTIAKIIQNQRKADNYAPIFAFIFALENTGDITPEFTKQIGVMLKDIKENVIEKDEDTLLDVILTSMVQVEGVKKKPVSELIENILYEGDHWEDDNIHLSRVGIKYVPKRKMFGFARKSQHIKQMVFNTDYASDYATVLSRHISAEPGTLQVNMSGKNTRSIAFSHESMGYILKGE